PRPPRLGGRRLYRPADEARGFPLGILLYPLAVLLLTLIFPARLDIVAAAWGVLALGDGAATLCGQAWRAKTAKGAETAKTDGLPWNREKTVAGTTAFVVCGGIGAVALAWGEWRGIGRRRFRYPARSPAPASAP